jgi:hypothetical protein
MITKKSPAPELKSTMTDKALEVAEVFGIKLDFTHKSIKRAERILGKIHKEYLRTKDDNGLNGIALFFAAYIISVIERHAPAGTWQRDHPDFGEDSFPYQWQESTLFPYAWCQKRIFDGKQDDIWAKYQSLVLPKITEQ